LFITLVEGINEAGKTTLSKGRNCVAKKVLKNIQGRATVLTLRNKVGVIQNCLEVRVPFKQLKQQ
jgi:hypothetical protein